MAMLPGGVLLDMPAFGLLAARLEHSLLGAGLLAWHAWLLQKGVLEINYFSLRSSRPSKRYLLACRAILWRIRHWSSSMSLNEVWEGAAGSPFYPTVSKERQFLVAFSLLLVGQFESAVMGTEYNGRYADWRLGFILTSLFGLSESPN